jgi:protein-tyrosine phosphatase
MVCLGNICRSPMAAAVAHAMVEEADLSDAVSVGSFGTAGYHTGEGADRRAEQALARRGWTAGAHRARRLRPEDVAAADLVLCADHANVRDVRRLAGAAADAPGKLRLLRSFDPASIPGRDDEVPDPWAGGDDEFDVALALIERACCGLVAYLAELLAA